jgi:hypothetical protein
MSINLTSCKWTHILSVFLCLAYFTKHVFRTRPCCSMCQYFLPFKGLIVLHLWRPWTVTTFCFISSAVDGYLGVFHLLAVVNNTAMSRVSTFFKFLILLFLGIYPEVALLDLMAILCLIFLKTPPIFSGVN